MKLRATLLIDAIIPRLMFSMLFNRPSVFSMRGSQVPCTEHTGEGKVQSFQGEMGVLLSLSRTLLVASTFGKTSAGLWEGIYEDAGGGMKESMSPEKFNKK